MSNINPLVAAGVLLFGLLVSGYIIWLFYTFLDQIFYRRSKKEFLRYLDEELENENLDSIEDLERIQKSVAEEKGYYKFLDVDLQMLLRNHLKKLALSDSEESDQKYEELEKFLEKLRESQPYANLPEKEQNVASNLESSIRNGDAPETSINMLKDLTKSIGDKYNTALEEKKRNAKWNKLSVLFGILGFLVGIGSILVTIYA